MTKQFISFFCVLSIGCSAGLGGSTARGPEHASCAGGVVRSQSELERYDGCTTIDGDLLVENVESLAPLGAVVRVDGNLRIEHTRHLYSLAGLERLESVRELGLYSNRGLVSGGALHELTHAERVHIAENPRLSRGYGFDRQIARSRAALELENNAGLEAEGMKPFRGPATETTVAAR